MIRSHSPGSRNNFRFYIVMITLVVCGIFVLLFLNNDQGEFSITNAIVGNSINNTFEEDQIAEENLEISFEDLFPEENVEELLSKLLSRLIPNVLEQKTYHKFVGVRPLYKTGDDGRQISRDFQIIETPSRMLTVVGGKLTTARLMAEKVSNKICEEIGCKRNCTTDQEKLPKL